MMSYSEFISRFEVFDNPPFRKGFDRHHIVPLSEQKEPDNRQIYLTPTQHMWAHILYDREHGTNTADWFLKLCGKPAEYFDCWEKCFAYIYTLRKKKEDAHKKLSSLRQTSEYKKKMSESHKGLWDTPEKKQRMSKLINTPEALKKRSESMKRYCSNPENKKKMSEIQRSVSSRKKKVIQIKNGVVIDEFDSISEASRQTGIPKSSINWCCQGKTKNPRNYDWRYV